MLSIQRLAKHKRDSPHSKQITISDIDSVSIEKTIRCFFFRSLDVCHRTHIFADSVFDRNRTRAYVFEYSFHVAYMPSALDSIIDSPHSLTLLILLLMFFRWLYSNFPIALKERRFSSIQMNFVVVPSWIFFSQ